MGSSEQKAVEIIKSCEARYWRKLTRSWSTDLQRLCSALVINQAWGNPAFFMV